MVKLNDKQKDFLLELRTLSLNDFSKNNMFETVAHTISDSTLINKIIDGLLLLGFKEKLISRNFLCHYLILYFPNGLIGNPKSILEEKLWQICILIHEYYENTDINHLELENLQKITKVYNDTFNQWKKKDYQSSILLLESAYQDIGKYQGKVDPISFQKTISQLEKYAIQMGGNTLLDKMKTSNPLKTQSELLTEEVSDVIKQVFWDILVKELSQDPPNFKSYLNLIQEILERFKQLLPNKNNHASVKHLETQLSDTRILESLKRGEYTGKDVVTCCQFCLSNLAVLISPQNDKKLKTISNILDTKLKKNPSLNLHLLADIVSNVFKFTLETLDENILMKKLLLQ